MSNVKTWMPMYWGDYFSKTQRLTLSEHGAYLKLIGVYWTEGCALPDSDRDFMAILGVSKTEWSKIKPVITRFFSLKDGMWHHQRIDEEILKASDRQTKAKAKAVHASSSRWGKNDATSMLQASSMDCLSNAIICEGEGTLPREGSLKIGGRALDGTDPTWEADQ